MAAVDHDADQYVPVCVRCEREADCVIYSATDAVLVMCMMCANASIGPCDLEYPLEEWYEPDGRSIVDFNPPDMKFDLYDPDSSRNVWICADNEDGLHSYVNLIDWC